MCLFALSIMFLPTCSLYIGLSAFVSSAQRNRRRRRPRGPRPVENGENVRIMPVAAGWPLSVVVCTLRRQSMATLSVTY